MEREIYEKLLKWKQEKNHKPLILEGARQVGKTYIVNEFSKEYKNYAYFNFDIDTNLHTIFEQDLNIDRIILSLSAHIGFKIDSDTLIFFDEIQECGRAITSLKYFCEYKIKYDVIAAGSLLGISYSYGTGFPVGKVEFLKMYPLSFKEFLIANNEQLIVKTIVTKDYEIIKTLKQKLETYLKIYCFVGGMPEVVQKYIENKDFNEVSKIQQEILKSYDIDFSKHTKNGTLEKIRLVWNAIPSQLAKKNKKFKYSDIKHKGRAKEFENAIEFLKNAGLIYKINNIQKFSSPIKSYEDNSCFKIYMLDIGLLSNMNRIDANIINEQEKVFVEFEGSLAEQYVLNNLYSNGIDNISYYAEESNRNEIDFVIEDNNKVIPIEVKAGINLKAKSLNNIIKKYDIKKAIRYSLADYKQNEVIEDIPLYAI